MITGKITWEDLLIRVLPGGFLVAIIFFISNFQLKLNNKFDFLYSFLFFCVAFIAGEVLQTISHILEFIVNVFFKGYKPSEVFLYKNNPILPNENIRQRLLVSLNLSDEDKNVFEKEYKQRSFICKKKDKAKEISQGYFWKIYTAVEDNEIIKKSNINYLFLRVIMIDFLIVSVYLMLSGFGRYGLLAFMIFLILLWRARGLARGLVLKTALIYLK